MQTRDETGTHAQAGRRMTGDLFWSGCSTMVTLGTGLVLQLIIGNFLSVADMGTYMFGLSVFLTVGGITSGGLAGATLIEAARRSDDPAAGRSIILTGLLLAALAGCAGGLLLHAVAAPLARLCSMPGLTDVLAGLAFALPVFLVNRVLLNGFTAQSRMATQAAGYGTRLLLVGACTIVIVLRTRTLAWVGYAMVLAEVILLPVLLALSARGGIRGTRLTRDALKSIARLAMPMTLSSGLSNLDNRLDVLVTAPLLGDPVQVGLFTLALNMAIPVLAGAEAMQRVFLAGFCRLLGRNEQRAADDLLSTAGRLGFIGTGLFSLLLAATGTWLIHLLFPLRPELQAALPCVMLLLPAAVIRGGDLAVGGVFAALNVPRYGVWLTVGRLGLRLALLMLLVPLFSLHGAVTATGTTWIIKAVLTYALVRLLLRRRVDTRWMLLSLVGVLGAYTVVYYATNTAVMLAVATVSAIVLGVVAWRVTWSHVVHPPTAAGAAGRAAEEGTS